MRTHQRAERDETERERREHREAPDAQHRASRVAEGGTRDVIGRACRVAVGFAHGVSVSLAEASPSLEKRSDWFRRPDQRHEPDFRLGGVCAIRWL